MAEPSVSPRQLYLEWVEEQIEDFKDTLPREELLQLADEAVEQLMASPDGQIPLTEILLRDSVDALIFRRLALPTYRQWLRLCQTDTPARPPESTPGRAGDGEESRN